MTNYWKNEGKYQADYQRLYEGLVPGSGPCQTVEGEFLRAVSKIYYDAYNNGTGNKVSGALLFLKSNLPGFKQEWFDTLAPYVTGSGAMPHDLESIYEVCEEMVDHAIVVTVAKNGEYAPFQGDMFSYQVRETGHEYLEDRYRHYEDDDDDESLTM